MKCYTEESMRLFNSATEYHERTKFSFEDVKTVYQEFLSLPERQPVKDYPNYPIIELPQESLSQKQLLSESYNISSKFNKFYQLSSKVISLEILSQLLYLTNGVTRVKEYNQKRIFFRASPSGGALYPAEIYLCVNNVESLEKGLYYYNVHQHSIVLIQDKDCLSDINEATFNTELISQAPLVFILTAVFERIYWKYKDRTFRYALMDIGYILENLVLASAYLNLKANLIGDFIDMKVNDVLNINHENEATFMVVAIGESEKLINQTEYEFGMFKPETDKIETKYKNLLEGIYITTSHFQPNEDLTRIQVQLPFFKEPMQKEPLNPIDLPQPILKLTGSTQEIIKKRSSAHHFVRASITIEELSTILYFLGKVPVLYNFPAYFTYIVASEVEGLDNGIYLYHPSKHQIELLKKGTFRGDISYLTLAQDAVFNCSVSIFFSVDFKDIDTFSNRGYRYAHLNVGMLSECIYLTSTTLGLATRGIGNFFDDNINNFFNVRVPHENVLGGVIIGKI